VDWKQYNYARLAWYYMTGEWPALEIDHINRNPSDNRFSNLRLATRSQNTQWSRRGRKPRSGFRGVHRVASGRYQAQISVNGKKRHIGIFDSAEEAAEAFLREAVRLRGDFAYVESDQLP